MSTRPNSIVFDCLCLSVNSKLKDITVEIHNISRLMELSGNFPSFELQELRRTADSISDVTKSLKKLPHQSVSSSIKG